MDLTQAMNVTYELDKKGTKVKKLSLTVNGVKYVAGKSVIPNSTFNALYYYLNYKDVRDAIGANPQTLVDNWVLYGE